MIIGKNSAKLGFTWFFIGIIKIIVSVSAISYIKDYTFIGIVGIVSFAIFVYEQIKKFKQLSN